MLSTYHRLGVSVYVTNREVIAAARKKVCKCCLKRDRRTQRHAFYRDMLEYHRQARDLVHQFCL